jgi:hypothetical protein
MDRVPSRLRGGAVHSGRDFQRRRWNYVVTSGLFEQLLCQRNLQGDADIGNLLRRHFNTQ